MIQYNISPPPAVTDVINIWYTSSSSAKTALPLRPYHSNFQCRKRCELHHSISIWNMSACWTRNGCYISSPWLILTSLTCLHVQGSCSLLNRSKTIQFLFIIHHHHPHQTEKRETFFNRAAGGLNISTSLIYSLGSFWIQIYGPGTLLPTCLF